MVLGKAPRDENVVRMKNIERNVVVAPNYNNTNIL